MKFRDYLDSFVSISSAVIIVLGMLYGIARLSEPKHVMEPAAVSQPAPPALPPQIAEPAVARQAFTPAEPTNQYEQQPQISSSDLNTLNALRTNCFNAARNNSTGEYPATQQLACNDYLRFAWRKGITVNDVPTVLIAEPNRSTQSPTVVAQQTDIHSSYECGGLYHEKDSIDEAMRNGYTADIGERYRDRLREINKQLYDHRCVRPYGRQR